MCLQCPHSLRQVIEFMESKTPTYNLPVHVINIDIQDNHEEATVGAFAICDLITMVSDPDSVGCAIVRNKRKRCRFELFLRDNCDHRIILYRKTASINVSFFCTHPGVFYLKSLLRSVFLRRPLVVYSK